MSHPALAAADQLTAQLDTALATGPDSQATLQALAAAVGLLAMVMAQDAQQVTEVGRLMADLQATEAGPEQAVGSLGLLIARHALGSREEAARAVAAAWQAHAGQPLAAGARLLVLAVTWLDADGEAALELGRAELALEAGGTAEVALDSALRALCLLLGATPPEPSSEPLSGAFAAALAAVRQLVAETG